MVHRASLPHGAASVQSGWVTIATSDYELTRELDGSQWPYEEWGKFWTIWAGSAAFTHQETGNIRFDAAPALPDGAYRRLPEMPV